MRPALFSTLISFDEALRQVLDAAVPVHASEVVPLLKADDRVTAADILSPADVPAFDRSAMDGYAVHGADVSGASVSAPIGLSLVGEIFTGARSERPLAPGECMAIATGAPLPLGADAVVMVEATRSDAQRILFSAPAVSGQNISRRGSDIKTADMILRRGDRIGPARIGSLAAIGVTSVEVFRKPSVAIVSSGDEVTSPGVPLPDGHVYDVNRFTLEAIVTRHGGIATPLSTSADTVEALVAALDMAAGHDVIVFSGGSSVGRRDLLLDAIRTRGEVLFHGIAVKPGKPTLLARIGPTIVFGMPGNPTSCLSNAYMLLVPFLRKAARLLPWEPRTVDVLLSRRLTSTADRHQFYPVRLVDRGAEPVFKSSGDITSMARADGFIEIPASIQTVEQGTVVTVKLF